jgi:hypothetical protein
MFLWVTSPGPATYGGGGRVFVSPVFFDVTPPDASGNRTLVKHTAGSLISVNVRGVKVGPHGLQVRNGKDGLLWEVVPPVVAHNGKQLILNAGGDTVEIVRAVMGEKHTLMLYDAENRLIEKPKPILPKLLKGKRVMQPITAQGINVFLDEPGAVIEPEQGQADGAVLQTQNGSLVYYSIMVNDVFAYYLTGVKDNAIVHMPGNLLNPFPNTFPILGEDLSQITAFAKAHGVPKLPDSVALVVELKASWVESSTLTDPQNYITMDGMIPTYDKTDPNNWVLTGTQKANLALVGIHVVGSVANHPEMIWATFEHKANTPNGDYSYFNTGGNLINVPMNTSGNWLFCADGAAGNFNQEHMHFSGTNIQSIAPFSISPSNTLRWKAWGNASDTYPSQDDPSPGNPAYSNTRIISINNNVHSLLADGDIRTNYNFIGATWTVDGSIGNEGNGQGTSRLCNSTMETYQLGSNTLFATGGTCFSCHSAFGNASSHIFGSTAPLF